MKNHLTPVTVTFKVHPDHCKSFPDPNGKGRKRLIAQVSVDEITAASVDFGPNPRNQNPETKVSKAIAEGLTAQPGWFLYFNRGIVWNAESVEYDNQSQELTVRFMKDSKTPWESPFGNLDGGHTNRVITNHLRDGWRNFSASSEKQYVTLEILTGVDSEKLSTLVGARNTNMPVKDLSLLVLGEDIDWLTDILKERKVYDKINWRQFDTSGDVEGQDVIATLSLLNPALEVKTRCYNGPGRIISDLKIKKDQMNGLKSIKDIAFEYLKFVDYLHSRFEDWYKDDSGLKGKAREESTSDSTSDYPIARRKKQSGFGLLSGVAIGETELVFLEKTIRYKLVKSWLLPLAFSFSRVVISERKNSKVWYDMADRIGPKLYSTIRKQTDEANGNLDKIGKSSVVWDSLEAHVWAEYMSYRLQIA